MSKSTAGIPKMENDALECAIIWEQYGPVEAAKEFQRRIGTRTASDALGTLRIILQKHDMVPVFTSAIRTESRKEQ